eukprot:917404-Prorocentrum_minimum.AAC.6
MPPNRANALNESPHLVREQQNPKRQHRGCHITRASSTSACCSRHSNEGAPARRTIPTRSRDRGGLHPPPGP